MTFTDAIKTCFNKYATFSGRATRSEYWWFFLFYIIAYIALIALTAVSESLALLALVFSLGMLIPSIAVGARRLHDTDKSAWWLLLGIVPLIGLLLIYFLAIPGTQGDNRFGPEPS